ncbi:MAG: exopolysaccharide biosynthesis polyprenyl glycosylphosphotransferase [Candidatus Taylorbacteria bacterium]|nr:exopolysaccharide biosynthesis polyprenyl glycosylphosphotransferase [Candidatus Taylorbacteria bacterium]
MAVVRKSESAWLLVGDIVVFVASLWLALLFRNFNAPSAQYFLDHLIPFSLLFVVWMLVFFIAGLYDTYTLLVKSRVSQKVITAHIFNVLLATLFFYVVPFFAVTPKVILALYLLVSLVLLGTWRFLIYPSITKRSALKVLVLGGGVDVSYLEHRVSQSEGEFLHIVGVCTPEDIAHMSDVDVSKKIKERVEKENISVVAIDLLNPVIQKHVPALYTLIFEGIQFVNIQDLYENVTDRVPLSLINETWFLEHASIEPNFIYDVIKRVMDLCISIPLFIVSLFVYPFVWIGMKLEDGGPMFYTPIRVGQGGKQIQMYKFRTMTVMDAGNQLGQNKDKITKLGKFMRVTRIDELPQLWNILKGDLSLIGPRPEFPNLVDLYNKEIPHYNVRHLIKPGLSGWAQIHHEKPPHTIEETMEKLAYDLYYIKNKSVFLDLKIALQTIKTLLSRVGA